MRKVIAIAIALLGVNLGVLGGIGTASAKIAHYRSQHPLPRKIGHGFCYIEVPHVHNFEPSDRRLYREIDGQYYFVGDPTAFEYQGPQYSFYGAHPVVEASVQVGGPVYCYLGGPHYHWYQPPPEARFEFRGGAYWYVGAYDPVYYQDRPRYMVVNDAYRPLVYTRPVVDISVVPPGFQGEILAAGSGWRGRAAVGVPVVSAGVQVAAPPPPSVQIGVGVGVNMGGPPPVRVAERRYEVHERHDRGNHNGWYKKHSDRDEDGWRGKPAPSGGWRGAPAPTGGWRGNAPPPSQASGGWRGNPAPQQSGNPQNRGNHDKDKDHDRGGGWRR